MMSYYPMHRMTGQALALCPNKHDHQNSLKTTAFLGTGADLQSSSPDMILRKSKGAQHGTSVCSTCNRGELLCRRESVILCTVLVFPGVVFYSPGVTTPRKQRVAESLSLTSVLQVSLTLRESGAACTCPPSLVEFRCTSEWDDQHC